MDTVQKMLLEVKDKVSTLEAKVKSLESQIKELSQVVINSEGQVPDANDS